MSRTLYHGTDMDFEQFADRTDRRADMHENGALGLWLGAEAQTASVFGSYLLEVLVPDDNPYLMPYEELRGMASRGLSEDDYREYAEGLRNQGHDLILLVEMDGAIDMGISLYPSRCEIVARTPRPAPAP